MPTRVRHAALVAAVLTIPFIIRRDARQDSRSLRTATRRAYTQAMKRLSAVLLTLLAACSNGSDDADSGTPSPSDQPGMFVVRVNNDGDETQILTLSEPTTEGAIKPDLVYWRLGERADVAPGETVTIIGSDGICAESYPPQCQARTVAIEHQAGDRVAVFGPYEKQEMRTEVDLAAYIGATVINVAEPLTTSELGDPFFDQVPVLETDRVELAGNPNLPASDTPIILIAPEGEVDDVGAVLFEEGFHVVISLGG